MRIRRIYLAALLGAASAAVAAGLAAALANPSHLTADVGGCVDVVGVSACTNVDAGIPNLNAVDNVLPNIPVPNLNSVLNPGHLGVPGRGR